MTWLMTGIAHLKRLQNGKEIPTCPIFLCGTHKGQFWEVNAEIITDYTSYGSLWMLKLNNSS